MSVRHDARLTNVKCKNISIEILKYIGMVVPKIMETRLIHICMCRQATIIACVTPIFFQYVNGNVFTLVSKLLMLYSPRAHAWHEPCPLSAALMIP